MTSKLFERNYFPLFGDSDGLKAGKVLRPSRKIYSTLYSIRSNVPATCRCKGFKVGSSIIDDVRKFKKKKGANSGSPASYPAIETGQTGRCVLVICDVG